MSIYRIRIRYIKIEHTWCTMRDMPMVKYGYNYEMFTVNLYIHTHTYTHAYARTHSPTHTHPHTHTHTYTHIHTHTHINTHAIRNLRI